MNALTDQEVNNVVLEMINMGEGSKVDHALVREVWQSYREHLGDPDSGGNKWGLLGTVIILECEKQVRLRDTNKPTRRRRK